MPQVLDRFQPGSKSLPSVGAALQLYAGANPKDPQTIKSIIKMLYPEACDLGSTEFQVFLNRLPLSHLAAQLSPDGGAWTEDVQAKVIERHPAVATNATARSTYLNRYPRFIKRFLDFLAKAGLVQPAPAVLLPEWQDFLAKSMTLVPATKAEVQSLLAAGLTCLLESFPLDSGNVKGAVFKVQQIRYALRKLALKASAAGLTPRQFAEAVLAGERGDELSDFATDTILCSYCRRLWNVVVANYPELDLPPWRDRRRQVGKPMDEWPASLRDGVNAALLERTNQRRLKPATVKGYRDQLSTFVGILETAGYKLDLLLGDLLPGDALRLVFAGWPRKLLVGSPEADSPLAVYRRLIAEPDFKQAVLAAMRAADGEPRQVVVENPFVSVVLQERLEGNKFAHAHAILDRVYTINATYLGMTEANRAWITGRLDQVDDFAEDVETAHDARKSVVFRHKHLFKHLLMREKALYESLDGRFTSRGPHWATFVRDLTYLVLVTLYPLRVKNFMLMKLGANYDPARHTIAFKKGEIKNRRKVAFELPSEGNGWVRDLVDLYLNEAREVLLRGAASDYVFVGNHQAPNARGMLARQAFNEILIHRSEEWLQGVLPLELGHLNPHMFRHIAATYQISVRRDPVMAAQLLNDDIKTVYKHYADILESASDDCKQFIEDFDLDEGHSRS